MEFYEEVVRVTGADGEPVSAHVMCRDEGTCGRLLAILPPHPSLGGDTQNNVMAALCRAGAAGGWVTARLRYRGAETGEVAGRPALSVWDELDSRRDYGVVVDDCARTVAAVRTAFSPSGSISLLGYSFGVLPSLLLLERLPVRRVVGISPPLCAHGFGAVPVARDFGGRLALIGGASDPFCPLADLRTLGAQWGAAVVPFEAEDHFYRGQEDALASVAMGFLEADKVEASRSI